MDPLVLSKAYIYKLKLNILLLYVQILFFTVLNPIGIALSIFAIGVN